MIISNNIELKGKHGKPILTDVFFESTQSPKPVVIFCHGYKGFKDWGAWSLAGKSFAKAGFFFVKFNFSHNGGTAEQPIDFPDLEAFGNDNYTKQLDDLQSVIDWIGGKNIFSKEINPKKINLIGHSRGGGIVLLKARESEKVATVITWAGVSDYASRFPSGEKLKQWKEEGVYYIQNGRTKQQMPHYYQYYEDFQQNKERFNIQKAVKSLKKPQLIVHGTTDETVSLSEAQKLHEWNPNSELAKVDGAGHTFGAKHPWEEKVLPDPLKEAVDESIDFLNKF